MSTKRTHPRDPSDLSTEAKRLYDEITADYDLSPAERQTLIGALVAADMAIACEAVVARDGPVVTDRFGQTQRSPAAVMARDLRREVVVTFAALGIVSKYAGDDR